ncbi:MULTISPECIES: hypothetical protein [unclassified Thiocapsa]|uniref:hypothetical protein n=1 Tax=unclassified Thiocapsa TaxID=2641286 RepID=UPI0035AD9989
MPRPKAPPRHIAISDLVKLWEQDDAKRAALDEGRRWIAATFYDRELETVEVARRHKGWTQTGVVEAMPAVDATDPD